MIRRLHFILFLCLIMLSCKQEEKIPSDILPPAKMQALFWDLFRTTNFVTSYRLPTDSSLNKNAEQIKWYNRVLQLHQVTEKQFKQSMDFYKKRPDLFSAIMDSISRKEKVPVPNRKPEIKSVE